MSQHSRTSPLTSRRSFLQGTGLGLLSFSLAGAEVLLSPRQARAQGADFKLLEATEVSILEAFGEVLVPGARAAGIAHFVDQQMSVDPNESLFMAKYLNVPAPYADFYRSGLAALNGLSLALFDQAFDVISQTDAVSLVRTISSTVPDGWEGPPAPLFYICVRADAVDVTYGSIEGFAKLKIPYMPHILPPENW